MKTDKSRILVVDDNEDILIASKLLLKKQNMDVVIEKDPRKIPFHLNNDSFDVILLDMNFSEDTASGEEGFHWLAEIKKIDPEAVVIMITAYGDVEIAVESLKKGATDFVLKPWQNEKLVATINSASKLGAKSKEVVQLKETNKLLSEGLNEPFKDIIGNSPAMQNVFNLIDKVAATDANILILGENGTGKELIARAIHNRSLRKKNNFVSVDMGAITESLFESELFGHKKGAFTDAREDRIGRFEVADQGSLFLDEIGNLSSPLQSKLLTALQSRMVTRIGTNKSIKVDIRLVCATNMPLYEMVKDNTFRQDLLYRINTVEIKLPPLRDRDDDIKLLAQHFIKVYGKKYRKDKISLGSGTLKKLKDYSWPGNIRELQHAMERAVIMCESNQVNPEDFVLMEQSSDQSSTLNTDSYNLENVEKTIIEQAIQKHHGNISKAAKELGLTRASLYRRLEKHGL